MMKLVRALALLALTAAPAMAQTSVQTAQVQAELLVDRAAVAPGKSVWVGLDLKIKSGWHTYWRTPGDSGQATSITWTLPPGVTAEPIQWPAPDRVEVLGIMNFGYHDHVTLLTELKVDPAVAPANAVIKADATWLVCADVCIPEDGAFSIPLKIDPAASGENASASAAIQAVRDALPQPAPWPVKVTRSGDQLTFAAGPGIDGAVKSATYFPYQDGLIVNAAPQTTKVSGGGVNVAVDAEKKSETIANAAGLLVLEREVPGGGTTKVGYSFDSPISWTGPAAGGEAETSFALALLFAFIGGIILNVMPCVLPVLVMKALSFIKQGASSARERQKDALFYTAGVVAAFTALVASLAVLRAAGAAVGWGFQLQSPMFVAILAYVMLLLGLNLSGVFVIGGSFGMGQSLASKPGATGSFFTGLLAVVVATPCTVPFMGTAVGFALTQSPVMGFAIFEALALGLAFPYLLLAFIPGAGRLLPRPGAWMDRVKQVLAFPLYGASAWLIWVLAQQVDPIGLAFGFAGVVAVGFAAWMTGIAQISEPRGRQIGLGFAGLAGVAVIAVIVNLSGRAAASPAAQASGTVAEGAISEPFSAARLKELQAAGRPVLVNFTAAWCLTCIVNERVALSHQDVADALKGRNVAYLKADWTNRNTEITGVLHGLGRDGVPLYVLYDAKGGQPKILPQLLTPALVTEAIGAL